MECCNKPVSKDRYWEFFCIEDRQSLSVQTREVKAKTHGKGKAKEKE